MLVGLTSITFSVVDELTLNTLSTVDWVYMKVAGTSRASCGESVLLWPAWSGFANTLQQKPL